MRTPGYHEDFDRASASLVRVLGHFNKSRTLQDYASRQLDSLFYSNLISNFFRNLNEGNAKRFGLSSGVIRRIKMRYEGVISDAKDAISSKSITIDEKYYSDFRQELLLSFPESLAIIREVERRLDARTAGAYLEKKKSEIRNSGKSNPSLQEVIMTSIFEAYVRKNGRLPNVQEVSQIAKKTLTIDFVKQLAVRFIRELEARAPAMLSDQAILRTGFETRLQRTWKTPLDLLECIIIVATETGEGKRQHFAKNSDDTNRFRRSAIIRIHARTVQIAREILNLLKGGYADGASSRWRSLHELAVISLFLRECSDDVAQRYLEHGTMRTFREARDFEIFRKQLGYPPLTRNEFKRLERRRGELILKYGQGFKSDYGWIPVNSVLSHAQHPEKQQVDFRTLESHVNMGKWRPFYNLSSDSVHGGSRGFHRLGLIRQGEVLLAGPSNYGLADPLQNTAISLSQVTSCLLSIEPTFEDAISILAMIDYTRKIGLAAVKVQRRIELKERGRRRARPYSSARASFTFSS